MLLGFCLWLLSKGESVSKKLDVPAPDELMVRLVAELREKHCTLREVVWMINHLRDVLNYVRWTMKLGNIIPMNPVDVFRTDHPVFDELGLYAGKTSRRGMDPTLRRSIAAHCGNCTVCLARVQYLQAVAGDDPEYSTFVHDGRRNVHVDGIDDIGRAAGRSPSMPLGMALKSRANLRDGGED